MKKIKIKIVSRSLVLSPSKWLHNFVKLWTHFEGLRIKLLLTTFKNVFDMSVVKKRLKPVLGSLKKRKIRILEHCWVNLCVMCDVRGADCYDERVCLSACPRAYLRTMSELYLFYAPCYTWLGPLLVALRYVVNFRFCGWRYICSGSGGASTAYTRECITTVSIDLPIDVTSANLLQSVTLQCTCSQSLFLAVAVPLRPL